MSTISNLSSIATLILFILYFLGRIWVIKKNKDLVHEKFELDYTIYDEIERRNEYDLGGIELLTISSDQGLNWIKVYEINYSGKKNKMVLKSKKPVVDHHKILNIGEKLYLKINVPDGMPIYRIKYQRNDYIQGSFDIGFDGRYGEISKGDYRNKLTLKSYLYYISK